MTIALLMGAYQHFGLDYWMEPEPDTGPAQSTTIRTTITKAGKLIMRGPWHHVLPSYLAKFFRGTKEVVARIPGPLHTEFHRRLDNLMRLDGFPPMNQKEQWLQFMKAKPGKIQLIRMRLRQFSAQFELEHNLRGLVDAVDSALP